MKFLRYVFGFLALAMIISCETSIERKEEPIRFELKTNIIAPSLEHPAGGYSVTMGIGDNIQTIYIWNGANGKDGKNGLDGVNGINGKDGVSVTVKTESVAPDQTHPFGGILIIITDATGVHKTFVANGADGKNGLNGLNGLNGRDGKDGINGKDGISATIKTETITPNSDFPYGAILVTITDVNGIHKTYIRNGADGKNGLDGLNGKDGVDGINGKDGISATIKTENIAPCSDFQYGAIRVTVIDASGTHVSYVRNGADGQNGLNGKDGKDGINGIDGINGKDGISATIKTEEIPACPDFPYGAIKITVIDVSGTHVSYVRNGADGQNGLDGINGVDGVNGINGKDGISATVKTEEIPVCPDFPYGAVKITVIDVSGTHVSYVRNGADGKNGLDGLNGVNGINGLNGVSVTVKTIKVDPCPAHPTGGYYLTMTDVNGEHTVFIANGANGVDGIDGTNGAMSFIYVENTVPVEYCQFGGYVIITGMDTNGNGVLDESEKTRTYFCNPNPAIPNEGKVAICHKEEKSNSNKKEGYHTIYVPQSAVPAHLNHGDVLGECK